MFSFFDPNTKYSSTILKWCCCEAFLFECKLLSRTNVATPLALKGLSPATPEAEVRRRHAEEEMLIQAHLQVSTTCSLNLSAQENTATYRCLLSQNEHIHAIVASLTVVLLFVNMRPRLNYKAISQFKAYCLELLSVL